MPAKVQISINPKTGQVEFEIEGVAGSSCTDITSALAKGHVIQDERLTEDYYTPAEEPAYVGD